MHFDPARSIRLVIPSQESVPSVIMRIERMTRLKAVSLTSMLDLSCRGTEKLLIVIILILLPSSTTKKIMFNSLQL